MKRTVTWGMVIAVLLAMVAPAWAADQAAPAAPASKTCKPCVVANDDSAGYLAHAGSALAQGAGNVLFGWTEFFIEPVRETKAGGNVAIGFAKGIGHTIKRTGLGALEMVTFWAPKCHGKYPHFNTDCPLCSPKP